MEAFLHSLSGEPDAPAFVLLNSPAGHVYFAGGRLGCRALA